jgi:hypothetical protein
MSESARPEFRKIRDRVYRTENEVFNCFDMPITNAATEAANGSIGHLIVNFVGGMSFEILRLRVRAMRQLGGKRRFHCDMCRKRVDDHNEKHSSLRR